MAKTKNKVKGTTTPVTTTPKALAEELGIDPKRLRGYLRKNHSRDDEMHRQSWVIDEATAGAAREYFANRNKDEESVEA